MDPALPGWVLEGWEGLWERVCSEEIGWEVMEPGLAEASGGRWVDFNTVCQAPKGWSSRTHASSRLSFLPVKLD